MAHPLKFSGEPPPSRLNLARHCLSGKPATKTALIVAGERTESWTYGALEDVVARLAAGLSATGLEAGERLFIRMGNSLDYTLVFLAANAIGAVPIPASSMLTAREVSWILADSGAGFIAWDGELELPAIETAKVLGPEKLAELKKAPPGSFADTAADDPAYLVYTSGTSGTPKGVLHAQRAIWGRRPMYEGWYGIGPGDVMLHTGAFNWTYTLGTGLTDPFVNGATAIVYTGPRDPAVWGRLISEHGATIMASVPGVYRQLLRTGFAAGPSLRHGLVAGEALPLSILQQWRERTGRELYEAMGMSEISTYISCSPTVAVRQGSPGKPQRGRAVRILENGEIGVHASDPGLMLRYWNGEAPGEWFATGDLASMDSDGYIWREGRAGDMMNAGGYRVSPLEVEAVLQEHPCVAEAGVREWRVSDTASIIAAFVVPRPGAAPDEAAITSFAAGQLAAYKCPKQVWFVTSLPRTANGKLVRKALKRP